MRAADNIKGDEAADNEIGGNEGADNIKSDEGSRQRDRRRLGLLFFLGYSVPADRA